MSVLLPRLVLLFSCAAGLATLACDSGLDRDAPSARGTPRGQVHVPSSPHEETAGSVDWLDGIESSLSAELGAQEHLGLGPGTFPSFPLPEGDPPPLGRGLFRSGGFSVPLPLSPVWNPPGPKRVGLQVGHWFNSQLPSELQRLSPGASSGGWAEWEVNLLVARLAAAILEDHGVEVDLLPAVIPVRYRSHAFVAIHADGDTSGRLNGFKVARPGFSSIPTIDDDLVEAMYEEYGLATGLPRDSDSHISRRMLYYYAFNTRRYQHAIDLGTPAAIIEMGYLTHGGDRAFMTARPELAASGIAKGVLRFLEREYGAPEWKAAGFEKGGTE